MSIIIGGTFSYLIPTIGVPILVVLFCISCLLIWKAYSRTSIIIPSLLIAFCVIGLAVWQSYFSERKKLNFATPVELMSPLIQNRDIYISDLARNDVRVYNKTFENCHFFGPAVIGAEGSMTAYGSCFMATVPDPNKDFFIETTNEFVLGAVIFKDCNFRNCTFHKIAFIGTHEYIINLKKIFKDGGSNLQ